MIKVGYDAQAFLFAHGGAGKGAQLRTLLGRHSARFIGFTSRERNAARCQFVQEGLRGHTLWEQISLPGSLRKHKIDIFLAPENTAPYFLPHSVRLILVLHDTILLQRYKQTRAKAQLMHAYRRAQIPYSVARAETILTVSEHSRSEILRLFPGKDVRVIPCTIGAAWFEPLPLVEREDYLLLVTSSAPHKNFTGAFQAYAKFIQKKGCCRFRLKVVGLSGQKEALYGLLKDLGIGECVTILPFLSEEELRGLYRKACAVIVPSFAEGFGIPVLEAMSSGAPVCCSNAASLPEVGGEAPRYFNPNDTDDIACVLDSVTTDGALRDRMSVSGFRRSLAYHPSRISQLVDQFWNEKLGATGIRVAAPRGGTGVHTSILDQTQGENRCGI